jgi:hypothetical protein
MNPKGAMSIPEMIDLFDPNTDFWVARVKGLSVPL